LHLSIIYVQVLVHHFNFLNINWNRKCYFSVLFNHNIVYFIYKHCNDFFDWI